jgi:N-acetylglucosaminyldiphosphoundecaprenol N-acetyl-beta-D-mannosaminyltransferase
MASGRVHGAAPTPLITDTTLWAPVTLLRVPELHAAIDDIIARDAHELVLNVNVHCMNLAWEQPWLRALLEEAAIVFCDGAGVALALRLFGGERVPERITYASWMWQLAEHCARRQHGLFFVGAAEGVAAAAAARLAERFPALRIAGTQHGYFARDAAGSRPVIDAINRSGARILVVGLGMPAQERWLADHRAELRPNVLLSGGAVFDFVSGRVPRGPSLLVDHGFEWLARLAHEPRRLWRRYLVGNPLFFARAVRWRVARDGRTRRAV